MAEGVEVVDARKRFAFLPFVNGSGLFEAEVRLNVSDGQSALHAETADVASRFNGVDDRKRVHNIPPSVPKRNGVDFTPAPEVCQGLFEKTSRLSERASAGGAQSFPICRKGLIFPPAVL